MTSEPQTWHYGLVARWWAEFNNDGPEIPYFQGIIERNGQPALDVACGTGRLLIPFLRAGLDVDGCDISPDMLALCREKAEREGLEPHLYQQAMHELDLPRKYKTIIICGSFSLGGERSQDQEAMRRFYKHLEPGGVLAFDYELPYDDPRWWQYWLAENRREIPRPWAPPGERTLASDGTELELRARVLDLNPLEQTFAMQMHAEQWRDGKLIAEEEHTLKTSLYFKNEIVMMLEQAGFGNISVYGAYTEQAATKENTRLVFAARK
jgi:SAM-dependent methyltransferase